MTEKPAKPSWLSPAPPNPIAVSRRVKRSSVAGALRRFETMLPAQFDAYKVRTMGERVAQRLFRIAVHGEDGEGLRAIGQICDRLMGKSVAQEIERPLPEAPIVQILPIHTVAPLPMAEEPREVEAEVVDVEPQEGQNGDS